MATIEEYIEHVDNEIAGLAAATGGLAKNIENIYEAQREMIKENSRNLSPVHNSDELPLFTGNQSQVQELMDIIGKYRGFINGDIPNMVYDNTIAYYSQGRPGLTIAGVEAEDHTPVGLVSHPAPLDITSAGYVAPLVIQFGEQLWNAAFPKVKISNDFLNDISIADTMANVARIEAEEAKKPLQHETPSETTSQALNTELSQPFNHKYKFSWTVPGQISEPEKGSVTGRKTRTSRSRTTKKPKDKSGKTVQGNSITYNFPPIDITPIHDYSDVYIR